MFNLKKRVLFGLGVSMLLAMAIGSFALGESQTPVSPMSVEAQSAVGATAGPFTVEGGTQGTDYDYVSPVLTIHSGNLTISTNGETNERIVVDGAATITLEGVNISTAAGPALQIQDDAAFNVNILLADGSINSLKGDVGSRSSPGSPGIQKNGSGDSIGTLTIGVQDGSAGTGKLDAGGEGWQVAGIGGGNGGSASKITITGGEVTANGGYEGSGIGGGNGGNGSNITITGGEVTATGGQCGAGIGGGQNGSGSNIMITGGEVTANSTYGGAGIGGGKEGSGSDITINGGVVRANGGQYGYGAGIGGGAQGDGSNITITGGEVTAYGGDSGAGIGGVTQKNGSNIKITGGVVEAYGGKHSAGIGGGVQGAGSNITIIGGVVRAYGGGGGSSDDLSYGGAGIGGGSY